MNILKLIPSILLVLGISACKERNEDEREEKINRTIGAGCVLGTPETSRWGEFVVYTYAQKKYEEVPSKLSYGAAKMGDSVQVYYQAERFEFTNTSHVGYSADSIKVVGKCQSKEFLSEKQAVEKILKENINAK